MIRLHRNLFRIFDRRFKKANEDLQAAKEDKATRDRTCEGLGDDDGAQAFQAAIDLREVARLKLELAKAEAKLARQARPKVQDLVQATKVSGGAGNGRGRAMPLRGITVLRVESEDEEEKEEESDGQGILKGR